MTRTGKTRKSLSVPKSVRAGLVFPVPRIVRHLRTHERASPRVSVSAGVYMAAVMEYLAAEVLELSGNCASQANKKRIVPRHIMLALNADEEFHTLMSKNKVTVVGAGVPENIQTALLPSSKLAQLDKEDSEEEVVKNTPTKRPQRESAKAVTPKKKKSPSTPKPAKKTGATPVKKRTAPTTTTPTTKKTKKSPPKAGKVVKSTMSSSATISTPAAASTTTPTPAADSGSDSDSASDEQPAAATTTATTAPTTTPAGERKIGRSGTFEQLGKKQLHLGQNLIITKSNLAKYDKCEAIVHPTNSGLSTSGMVGSELVRLGGATFKVAMASQKQTLAVTECCVTAAGDLNCQHVIHCFSPAWDATSRERSLELLEKTIENILKVADDKGLKSVALPSIGSGKNGYPKDEAARTILHSIDSYFMSIMSSSLKAVHFVLYDDESLDVYNKVYRHEFP